MVIARGHLTVIVRTTLAGPTVTLVTDRLRPAHTNWCSWQDCTVALAVNLGNAYNLLTNAWLRWVAPSGAGARLLGVRLTAVCFCILPLFCVPVVSDPKGHGCHNNPTVFPEQCDQGHRV